MPLPKQLPLNSKEDKNSGFKKKEVLANRYEVTSVLGSGNFGTAFLIKDIKIKDNSSEFYVVKKVFVGALKLDETVVAAQEANLLRGLDHPNIVRFHDSFVEGEYFCLVTEFCDGGDLDDRILAKKKEKDRFEERIIINWIIELLMALQYMHSRQILHRDLKTKNIFLRDEHLKVGDFGISRVLVDSLDMAHTFVGTPYYMSPEVLKHEGYNAKSDIWSIGCILYDLVALQHPFNGTTLMAVMQKITEGDPPPWPLFYSDGLKNLFHKMIEKEPSDRPSASELLRLPFLNQQIETNLRSTIKEKHVQKDKKDVVRKEKENVRESFKKGSKFGDLKAESDEKRFRNLPPRDRIRIEKQRKADIEADKIKKLTARLNEETRASYDAIRGANNPYKSTIAIGENEPLPHQRTLSAQFQRNQGRFEKEESSESNESEESSSDDDEFFFTQLDNRSKSLNLDDDRQIKPMKNTAIYDLKSNAQLFDEGIPEDPELAEIYYDDFEKENDESNESSSSDEQNQTVIERLPIKRNKDEKIVEAESQLTKQSKIKALRDEAITILGKEKFDQAYFYLRNHLYKKANVNSQQIFTDLKNLNVDFRISQKIEQLILHENDGIYKN